MIQLRDASGATTIQLDADYSGDGRIITEELQITGGSDLSENFDLAPTDVLVEPGMILSIDPQRPGQLALSTEPYDHKVAGIISGADGVKPGLIMGQEGTIADGAYPVAITGRVYCLADASEHAIEPGDLLTTSAVPGHAMKVTDHDTASGRHHRQGDDRPRRRSGQGAGAGVAQVSDNLARQSTLGPTRW